MVDLGVLLQTICYNCYQDCRRCKTKQLYAHGAIAFLYAYLDLMRITALIVIINPIIQIINFFFDSHQITQLAWWREVIYFIIKGN